MHGGRQDRFGMYPCLRACGQMRVASRHSRSQRALWRVGRDRDSIHRHHLSYVDEPSARPSHVPLEITAEEPSVPETKGCSIRLHSSRAASSSPSRRGSSSLREQEQGEWWKEGQKFVQVVPSDLGRRPPDDDWRVRPAKSGLGSAYALSPTIETPLPKVGYHRKQSFSAPRSHGSLAKGQL